MYRLWTLWTIRSTLLSSYLNYKNLFNWLYPWTILSKNRALTILAKCPANPRLVILGFEQSKVGLIPQSTSTCICLHVVIRSSLMTPHIFFNTYLLKNFYVHTFILKIVNNNSVNSVNIVSNIFSFISMIHGNEC